MTNPNPLFELDPELEALLEADYWRERAQEESEYFAALENQNKDEEE